MNGCSFIFRIKALILFAIAITSLWGCGRNDDLAAETVDRNIVETYPAQNEETAYTPDPGQTEIRAEEEGEASELSEDRPEYLTVPVNVTPQDVSCHVEEGLDVLGAMRRCASDGENIYLVYGTQDLYIMPLGADGQNRANVENPEGLDVCHIAMDPYGKVHLLMADSSGENSFIWQLDENLQVERVIELSPYLETKRMPAWFLVDRDGTYYLQWNVNRDGIIIDSAGELMYRFTPKSLGTGWIYQAAVGKDGQIYLLHSEQGEKIEIDRLDVANGAIIREDSPLYFTGDEVFSAMSRGTDTNLLLFSPYSGAWAYDRENEVMENRVHIEDIDFGGDLEFWPLTFLADGRLLLFGRDGEENRLKYVPLGR